MKQSLQLMIQEEVTNQRREHTGSNSYTAVPTPEHPQGTYCQLLDLSHMSSEVAPGEPDSLCTFQSF